MSKKTKTVLYAGIAFGFIGISGYVGYQQRIHSDTAEIIVATNCEKLFPLLKYDEDKVKEALNKYSILEQNMTNKDLEKFKKTVREHPIGNLFSIPITQNISGFSSDLKTCEKKAVHKATLVFERYNKTQKNPDDTLAVLMGIYSPIIIALNKLSER